MNNEYQAGDINAYVDGVCAYCEKQNCVPEKLRECIGEFYQKGSPRIEEQAR